jgi:hypothetical protein
MLRAMPAAVTAAIGTVTAGIDTNSATRPITVLTADQYCCSGLQDYSPSFGTQVSE